VPPPIDPFNEPPSGGGGSTPPTSPSPTETTTVTPAVTTTSGAASTETLNLNAVRLGKLAAARSTAEFRSLPIGTREGVLAVACVVEAFDLQPDDLYVAGIPLVFIQIAEELRRTPPSMVETAVFDTVAKEFPGTLSDPIFTALRVVRPILRT
jgi:hypothetical protein